jgi:hypothetical protein
MKMTEELAYTIIDIDDGMYLDGCEPLMTGEGKQLWIGLVEDAVAITEEYPYRWARNDVSDFLANAEAARLESEE